MPEKEKSNEDEEKSEEIKPSKKVVYPDGGWGWVVVAAAGISNFISIPVMQSFALLFKNRMEELNMSTTDLTTIINVNAAFGMSLGLITGPLLKKLGYRKVAIFASLSLFVGICTTSWATKFIDFLITYSLITSMGSFLLMSCYNLAINSYFHERRGYATGMATTLTGLGPVVMPQVITFLLYHYDTTWTTMILGAMSLHSFLGALLLQPVKWHLKFEPRDDVEKEDLLNPILENGKATPGETRRRTRRSTVNSVDPEDIDSYSLYGFETPLVVHRKFGSTQQITRRRKSSAFQRSISQNDEAPDGNVAKRLSIIKNDELKSQDAANLDSSGKIVYEKVKGADAHEKENNVHVKSEQDSNALQENDQKHSFRCDMYDDVKDDDKPESTMQNFWKFIVDLFDLTLLKDPGYIILMLGMSLAICAELNFSLFTPLILGDYGFSIPQTATTMSTTAIFDIIFRFLSPFIGGKLNFSVQTMYLISLIMLITARTRPAFSSLHGNMRYMLVNTRVQTAELNRSRMSCDGPPQAACGQRWRGGSIRGRALSRGSTAGPPERTVPERNTRGERAPWDIAPHCASRQMTRRSSPLRQQRGSSLKMIRYQSSWPMSVVADTGRP